MIYADKGAPSYVHLKGWADCSLRQRIERMIRATGACFERQMPPLRHCKQLLAINIGVY